jgi:hypothetical protein
VIVIVIIIIIIINLHLVRARKLVFMETHVGMFTMLVHISVEDPVKGAGLRGFKDVVSGL